MKDGKPPRVRILAVGVERRLSRISAQVVPLN
jgi:hypothetical protein